MFKPNTKLRSIKASMPNLNIQVKRKELSTTRIWSNSLSKTEQRFLFYFNESWNIIRHINISDLSKFLFLKIEQKTVVILCQKIPLCFITQWNRETSVQIAYSIKLIE